MATDTCGYGAVSFSDVPDSDGATKSTALTSVPADIDSVTAVDIAAGTNNLTTENDGSNTDTYGLSVRITSSGTVMAALNATGSYETFDTAAVHPNGSTTHNSEAVSFTYVNTGASQAQWDAATVVFRSDYTQDKGKDVTYYTVASETALITLTYTATASGLSIPVAMAHYRRMSQGT